MTLAAASAMMPGTALAAPETPHPVIELRQYKIVSGRREDMIALFEREFVESQEALGMTLLGMFRDLDDPDRFVWLRQFPSMEERARMLADFYYGPVWKAHRDEANPLLDDNDNVLLLRPAAKDLGFPLYPRDDRRAGLVVATIHYLWKEPADGFATFFAGEMAPALREGGVAPVAALMPERTPNNFPRLPVREGEKVFVWFAHAPDADALQRAWAKVLRTSRWKDVVAPKLAGFEEREAQTLRLEPTRRSRLR